MPNIVLLIALFNNLSVDKIMNNFLYYAFSCPENRS